MKLELRRVTKSFRSGKVLDDVSVSFDPGQIISLLGPNGAGKTSLIRCLCGIAAPDRGGVYYDDQAFRRDRLDLRRRVFMLPDFPPLFWEQSVLRNIAIMLRLYEADGPDAESRVLALLAEFDLLPLAERAVRSLSRGQVYKVSLVILLAIDAEVWILDEPFASGMDPQGIDALKRHSFAAAKRGRTIIYSTQILDIAERFSDRACLIYEGKIHAFDTLENLREKAADKRNVLQDLFRQLHAPSFEKALREGVRSRIRASPKMKSERRRAKEPVRSYGTFFNIGFLLIFPVFIATSATNMTGHPLTGLAATALLMLGLVFFQAAFLWAYTHQDPDIWAMSLRPIAESDIFRWEVQKFVLRSLPVLLGLAGAIASIAFEIPFSWMQWLIVLPTCVLAWATVIALAALAVLFLPRRNTAQIASILWFLPFLMIMIRGPMVRYVDESSRWLLLALPTAWPLAALELSLPDTRGLTGLPVLLAIGLTASIRHSLQQIRNRVHYSEDLLFGPEGSLPMPEQASEQANGPSSDTPRSDTADHSPVPPASGFLSPRDWSTLGWLERQLAGMLTAREKNLCESCFPNGYVMTRAWLLILKIALISIVAGYLMGFISPELRNWTWIAGFFLAGILVLNQFLGNGVAFREVVLNGLRVPSYAFAGIGFSELSRFLVNCSLSQWGLVIIFDLVATELGGVARLWPSDRALSLGLRASVMLMGARLIQIVFSFSALSNDTSGFRIRSVLSISILMFFSFAFLGLVIAGLFIHRQDLGWTMTALTVLDGYALLKSYQALYNAGRFDLMALPASR